MILNFFAHANIGKSSSAESAELDMESFYGHKRWEIESS